MVRDWGRERRGKPGKQMLMSRGGHVGLSPTGDHLRGSTEHASGVSHGGAATPGTVTPESFGPAHTQASPAPRTEDTSGRHSGSHPSPRRAVGIQAGHLQCLLCCYNRETPKHNGFIRKEVYFFRMRQSRGRWTVQAWQAVPLQEIHAITQRPRSFLSCCSTAR